MFVSLQENVCFCSFSHKINVWFDFVVRESNKYVQSQNNQVSSVHHFETKLDIQKDRKNTPKICHVVRF
jgi:hypothetical protein